MADTHSNETPGGISRRGFIQLAGVAGAITGLASQVTRVEGQIGLCAMDLTEGLLKALLRTILRTILRIRWHERTMADKMLSDPGFRAYNHFHAGQKAVQAEMRADPAMIWIFELTPPVASNAGMPKCRNAGDQPRNRVRPQAGGFRDGDDRPDPGLCRPTFRLRDRQHLHAHSRCAHRCPLHPL